MKSVMYGICLGVGIVCILVIVNFAMYIAEESNSQQRHKTTITKQEKKEIPISKIPLYIANRDMLCATDKDFVDSSPFLYPSNFARVPTKSTFILSDFRLSPTTYFRLSCGPNKHIYVCEKVFRQNFDTKTLSDIFRENDLSREN